MNTLKEMLLQYKNLTLELMASLESEDYDNLGELLDKRQSVINILQSGDYSPDEFKDVCERMGLLGLQKKLDLLYREKINAAKENMKRASSGKQVYQSYSKAPHVDSIFFNKKI